MLRGFPAAQLLACATTLACPRTRRGVGSAPYGWIAARAMNVKYQIFVSSTYEDLKAEGAEVIKACLTMGHIPAGMEMFP